MLLLPKIKRIHARLCIRHIGLVVVPSFASAPNAEDLIVELVRRERNMSLE